MDTQAGLHITVSVHTNGSGRVVIHQDNIAIILALTNKERRMLLGYLYHPQDDEEDFRELKEVLHVLTPQAEEKEKDFKLLPFNQKGDQ